MFMVHCLLFNILQNAFLKLFPNLDEVAGHLVVKRIISCFAGRRCFVLKF